MKFNRLIPELCVSDLERSLYFYVKILGFKINYFRPETRFAFLSRQGSQIMIEQNANSPWSTGKLARPFGRGINLQMTVDKLEPLLKSLKRHRYPLKVKPGLNWYRKGKSLLGVRECLVTDPDGYLLRFAEEIGTRRAR